jgi:hypothetical protein
MEQNAITAPLSHNQMLTDHQKMACQVIAQSISVMLSIRELIRQGYLFGAHILTRSLVERATILQYLHLHPQEIERWNSGWHMEDNAPGLAKMFDRIQEKLQYDPKIAGKKLTAQMNSLLHAKPDSAPWNFISVGENRVGHAVSKILDRPDLCDDLCANVIPWVAMIQGMMATYFPLDQSSNKNAP